MMDKLKYFEDLAAGRLEIITEQDIKASELVAEIERLQGEVERHKATVQSALAQLLEARAILSSGTAYEKLCAVAILDNGLAQLLELDSE